MTFSFALRGRRRHPVRVAAHVRAGLADHGGADVLVVRPEAASTAAWVFATAYIVAMAVCFFLRFRTGKWKSMRVIEAAPAGGHGAAGEIIADEVNGSRNPPAF